MQFYVGLHQPSDAQHFDRCMVSINRLEHRVSDFVVADWMLDSAAFTKLLLHGCYRASPVAYAGHVKRWARCGNLLAASTEDYMCEPFILAKTGLSVTEHQRLTIERYDVIAAEVGDAAYILPVLQGFMPREYVTH